jgi:predicted O-linked N-acetylglucosamine transferase (SPINDLY family)
MVVSDFSCENPDWIQQAQDYLHSKNYTEAANFYQQAIERNPSVKEYYWHLGLTLLLQGQETEAQTTWLLAMVDGTPEDTEKWVGELIDVLEAEAERRRLEAVDISDYSLAWAIRQHIREINPNYINNLLHLIGLSTLLKTYTGEQLNELNVLELLESKQGEVDSDLLMEVLKNVLDYIPFHNTSLQFVEKSLPYIDSPEIFLDQLLVPVCNKILYSFKRFDIAVKYGELGLCLIPDHPPLLSTLAYAYQNNQDYDKGIEIAKLYYSIGNKLAFKIIANLMVLRGLMSAGGYWDECCQTIKHQKDLLLFLIEDKPKDLPLATAISLLNSGFFFPYHQDNPEESTIIRSKVAAISQLNIEKSCQLNIEKLRQWQSPLIELQPPGRKLRIGYISHCLRSHSVGWLARWLFQYHNRDKFEIYAYMMGYELNYNHLQEWYVNHVDKAHQLELDGEVAAEKIYEDQVDILIDLDSVTLTSTCEAMVLKPAPIQVTWLGWDASGIPTIDYYIADPYVLPENAQDYYTEKIWRLPQTYLAVDGFEVGVPNLRRDELEISTDAIIFLSAQRGYKHHPETAKLQMQIIKAVPNSYFLIKGLADEESLRKFFIEIAESEGVSVERLKFLPLAPSEQIHRANLSIADIVLDTYPYNGATTTMETLWMGIPLITRVGQQFAARNSYTMMMNAGITEGIAWTDEEYVEWGIKLGTDENLRQQIAWKLRKNRQTAPLWNAKQFTREMENAYQQMWQKYIEGKN